jgi:hypothetical protein
MCLFFSSFFYFPFTASLASIRELKRSLERQLALLSTESAIEENIKSLSPLAKQANAMKSPKKQLKAHDVLHPDRDHDHKHDHDPLLYSSKSESNYNDKKTSGQDLYRANIMSSNGEGLNTLKVYFLFLFFCQQKRPPFSSLSLILYATKCISLCKGLQ